MINTGAFDPLSPNEKLEFELHAESFKQAVLESGTIDAFDFEQKYYLRKIEGRWCLARPGSNEAFANISVSNPNVMEALLNHALETLT